MPHRRPFKEAKRRQVLLAIAPLFFALGVSYTFDYSPNREASFGWLPWFAGIQAVGVAWLLAAVAATGIALLRHRLPKRAESLAFGATILPMIYTAGIFLASYLAGTNPQGYLTAFIYGGIAAVLVVVSSWMEHPSEARDA